MRQTPRQLEHEKEAYSNDVDYNEYSADPPRARRTTRKTVEPEPDVNDYNSPKEDIPD